MEDAESLIFGDSLVLSERVDLTLWAGSIQ